MPEATGHLSYNQAVVLQIYLYSSTNRIASRRQLERETQCNLKLMRLIDRWMPDFKTITNFRRDNGPAIKAPAAGLCCCTGS